MLQDPSSTVLFASAAPASPRIAVVVPTFRRPDHLRVTLASLADQARRAGAAIVVVDNDGERREGAAVARGLLESGEIGGLLVLARERGNCSAYNAGFAQALAAFPDLRYCLAIDDDERAGEGWIDALVAAAERFDADVVGGPQVPVVEAGGDARLAAHPVFQPPYARSGPAPILFSSGNVLIRRHVLERMGDPVLDTRFNFIGGGDADFYRRCRRQGFRFAWCAEAVAYETVPARRTEFSWIHARSLRNGAISALIEHRDRPGLAGRLQTLAKSAALLLASPPRAALRAARSRSLRIGLYPMQVALGRFQAEFGRVGEQYREPERN